MSEYSPEHGPNNDPGGQSSIDFDVDATIHHILNPEINLTGLHKDFVAHRARAVDYLGDFINLDFDVTDRLTLLEKGQRHQLPISLAIDNIAVVASEPTNSPDRRDMVLHAFRSIWDSRPIQDLDKYALEDCLRVFTGNDRLVVDASDKYRVEKVQEFRRGGSSTEYPYDKEEEFASKITLIKSVLDSIYVPSAHDDYQSFVGLLLGVTAVPGCIVPYEKYVASNFKQYARRLKISPSDYRIMLEVAGLPEDTKII